MISNLIAQSLIEASLAEGNKLRLHQNGFIQLDLIPNTRLHIWDENIPVAQSPRSPIHNHTFSFYSQVLTGELTHIEYEWIGIEQVYTKPIRDEDIVQGLYFGSGDYENLIFTGIWGTSRETSRLIIPAGEAYTFKYGLYHDSLGKGLTATIMTKTDMNRIPFATVVCEPAIGAPDNTFRRDKYPQHVLMPFIEAVLKKLR